MEISSNRRLFRIWLAGVSLALGLPWLLFAGTGICPLIGRASAAGAAQPQTVSGCCQHCRVTPETAARSAAPASQPTKALACCEDFRAYFPLVSRCAKIKWHAAQGDLLEKPFAGPVFDWASADHRKLDHRLAMLFSAGPPIEVDFHRMAQRGHPAHAPPLAMGSLG